MKQGLIVIALVVLVVIGGTFLYLSNERGREAPPAVEPQAELAPQPAVAEEDEPETPAFTIDEKAVPAAPELVELPLPPLNESDPYVQENLAGVVGEAATMQYFPGDMLVGRMVATVDALGSSQVPGNIQAMQGPGGSYTAFEDPAPPTVIRNEVGDPIPQYLSDPANHQRYLAYVEMLEAIDTDQFVALYRRNYPLFQQAWRELGYTGESFNDRLLEVIDELLATPDVAEPYRLVKPEAYYLFADEELEALSAGQKIMVRMGSENAARVKSKLSELRSVL